MTLARVLIALVLLAELAGAVVAFQIGLWPAGVVLVVGMILSGAWLARTWTGQREYPTGEYMENDRSYY